MTTASVADLKSRLSHFLRLVRGGAEVLITSHDHPVGKLVPYPGETEPKIIPATRSPGDIDKIRGVKPLHPVDVVKLLREDRDRR